MIQNIARIANPTHAPYMPWKIIRKTRNNANRTEATSHILKNLFFSPENLFILHPSPEG
ncbi:hypothetical protein LIX60_04010 [Streptomyces sp. S07_1.15]|uniref:hypothetical protein n=1 Tax=Streptomyces sp. S07_1.15 TaxID=2873925 RepID=UPI001D152EAA|nr:hypothetical protein [Streptomyces sp. S07_1.15]MCC3650664.1 hypothetical protein [Streptomyces sp. S07_1.15]